MISGDEFFYTQIIEPLGHRAREMNESFLEKKNQLINKFTGEFVDDYCNRSGQILWQKIVSFNSGNLKPKDMQLPLFL